MIVFEGLISVLEKRGSIWKGKTSGCISDRNRLSSVRSPTSSQSGHLSSLPCAPCSHLLHKSGWGDRPVIRSDATRVDWFTMAWIIGHLHRYVRVRSFGRTQDVKTGKGHDGVVCTCSA